MMYSDSSSGSEGASEDLRGVKMSVNDGPLRGGDLDEPCCSSVSTGLRAGTKLTSDLARACSEALRDREPTVATTPGDLTFSEMADRTCLPKAAETVRDE